MLLGSIVLLCILLLAFYFGSIGYCTIREKADYATYFNVVVSIFSLFISFFTVILLWQTFALQKEELNKTSYALSQQLINSDIERVENVCFKLLDLYKNRLSTFKYYSPLPIINDYPSGEKSINMFLKDITPEFLFAFSNNEQKTALYLEYKKSIMNGGNYSILKDLAYKFVAIYKTIFHIEMKYVNLIQNKQLEYLRFAINNQISPAEFVAIKTVILIEEDLHDLIPKLQDYSIIVNEENLMHELSLL